MKSIYQRLSDLHNTSPDIVLSIITSSTGSTPQKTGSAAIFDKSGLIEGTVGGGILEGKVQELSKVAASSRKILHTRFYLNRDALNGEDALCGGNVSVLVDPDPFKHLNVFNDIKSCLDRKIPGVLVTKINESTAGVTLERFWITSEKSLSALLPAAVEMNAGEILSGGDPDDYRKVIMGKEVTDFYFLEPVFPMPSLLIAGAGHIGKALAHLGSLLDFGVTIIDDRSEYANNDNIPDAGNIIVEDPGKALAGIDLTDAYVVIVTRGHKDDESALKACIRSGAAYIGMIGSRSKVQIMKSNFLSNGWATQDQWNRIMAPVGINIGSKTVQEIAVSIAAELVSVRRRKAGSGEHGAIR